MAEHFPLAFDEILAAEPKASAYIFHNSVVQHKPVHYFSLLSEVPHGLPTRLLSHTSLCPFLGLAHFLSRLARAL